MSDYIAALSMVVFLKTGQWQSHTDRVLNFNMNI